MVGKLKNLKDQRGFTLIELLVVIVIIGILIALVLPNLFSAQERARDTTRKNDLKNDQQLLETYYSDNNEYPPSGDFTTANGYTTQDPKKVDYTYTTTPVDCDNTDANICTS